MRWVLAGSAGRRLLGADRQPRDLDVEVADAEGDRAAAALGLTLAPAAGGGCSSRRAVGVVSGVEVDLSAGLAVRGDAGALPADGTDPRAGAEPRTLGGRTVWCAPPEEALVRALVAGDWARVAKVAAGGGPAPRLDYVARRLAAAIAAR